MVKCHSQQSISIFINHRHLDLFSFLYVVERFKKRDKCERIDKELILALGLANYICKSTWRVERTLSVRIRKARRVSRKVRKPLGYTFYAMQATALFDSGGTSVYTALQTFNELVPVCCV